MIQCRWDLCQSYVWASLLKCLISVWTHGCHKKSLMTVTQHHTFGVAPLMAVAATCVSHMNTPINTYAKSLFTTHAAATSVLCVKELLRPIHMSDWITTIWIAGGWATGDCMFKHSASVNQNGKMMKSCQIPATTCSSERSIQSLQLLTGCQILNMFKVNRRLLRLRNSVAAIGSCVARVPLVMELQWFSRSCEWAFTIRKSHLWRYNSSCCDFVARVNHPRHDIIPKHNICHGGTHSTASSF